MSIFSRLLGRKPEPIKGVPTDWAMVGSLMVTSGRVYVADSGQFPDEVVEVVVTSGAHAVELRYLTFGDDRRVAGLRVRQSPGDFKHGESLGAVNVDLGSILVCDEVLNVSAYQQRYADEKTRQRELENPYDSPLGFFRLPTTPSTAAFGCDTGFGDGCYEIMELLSGGVRTGFEIVFIADDVVYPF